MQTGVNNSGRDFSHLHSSSGSGASAVAAPEIKEAKTSFDLKLTVVDTKAKIKIIKEVRTITGLGLKEVS